MLFALSTSEQINGLKKHRAIVCYPLNETLSIACGAGVQNVGMQFMRGAILGNFSTPTFFSVPPSSSKGLMPYNQTSLLLTNCDLNSK